MALDYSSLLDTKYNYSGLSKTFAKDLSNVFLANEMEEALKKRKKEEEQQPESFSGSGEIGLTSMVAPLEIPSSKQTLIEVPTDVPGETEIIEVPTGLSSLAPQNKIEEQPVVKEEQPQAGLGLLSPSTAETQENVDNIEEPLVSFEEMANSIKDREKIQKYFNIPLDVDLLQSSLMYDAFQGKQPGTTARQMVKEYNDILREENTLTQAENNREYQRMKDAYQAKRQERLDKENIKKSKLEREDKLREVLMKAQKPSDLQQEIALLKQYGATNEEIRNHLLNKRKGYQATSIEDKMKLEDIKQKNRIELQNLKNKNKMLENEQKNKGKNINENDLNALKGVYSELEELIKKNGTAGIGLIKGSSWGKGTYELFGSKKAAANVEKIGHLQKLAGELVKRKLSSAGYTSKELDTQFEQSRVYWDFTPDMSMETIREKFKNLLNYLGKDIDSSQTSINNKTTSNTENSVKIIGNYKIKRK